MELKLFQDVVDRGGPLAVLVDAMERVACGLHRQYRYFERLAVRRDGGDAGGNEEANVAGSSQFVHVGIDLRALGPSGSRMDSALSRTMSISFEDSDCRKEARFSGFSIPAPMTLESRRRNWLRVARNSSQRMNLRFSPNRCLIRSSWRAARAMDVFPIPPAPIRAIDVRHPARWTILSISSSRPKKIPGGGGGSSPGTLDANVRPGSLGSRDC
jgi:hypothetical protein